VTEAANGLLGLEALARERPALVLLDLMMPEMDGFEFLDELRRTHSSAEIPVVVITAMTLTEADRRRLNGGVERVVQKRPLGEETVAGGSPCAGGGPIMSRQNHREAALLRLSAGIAAARTRRRSARRS